MACSRKDFVAIAAAFMAARADILTKEPAESQRDMLDGSSLSAEHVADALARTNPLFDRERFLAACGVKEQR